jgi:DNA-binding beta-propeller fold protein YncE
MRLSTAGFSKGLRAAAVLGIAVSRTAAAATITAAAAAGGGSGYHVIATWPVGAVGKWDYLIVDAPHHHLFVSRATHVQVIDTESGKAVGDIADTPGVHGIALAPALNRGFTSNGKGDSVTVFNLETLAPISVIKISGSGPDAIIYDAPSRQVFTFNGHSNNATIIDAAAAREVGSVALPGRPEFAVSDGAGRIFVNLEDKGEVAVIDVAGGRVQSAWSLAPCSEPTGLALDAARHRLFSVCHNERLIVTDSVTGTRVAELPIGKHVDAAAFDPATSLVFSSNGESADVSVIHAESADRYAALGSLPTAAGSKTMALDTTTHRLYVPAMGTGGFEILVAAPN